MAQLQPVRGTHDLLPQDERRHRAVIDTARQTAGRYGFDRVETPIFEFTEVFTRTVGETSDIVTKEMYVFEDRGGESIALRPEGTAGVARAVISNGLAQNLPLKVFYNGPMFRYERPQKGRQRQFHQIGIELIGPTQPIADVEVIACGADILDNLGILPRVQLELNTLGDMSSRDAYRAALVEYFGGFRDQLSDDSKLRLEKNPLRILDSKDEDDRKLVVNAPTFEQYLSQEAKDFFGGVTKGLDALGIPYVLAPRLVRGLDYYTHTCFEFVTTELGAQGTVMAGGRYDGLIRDMGGPDIAGVGWAAGIERLSMMLGFEPEVARPIVLAPLGEAAEAEALKLAHQLRKAGHTVDLGFSGNLKKRLMRANKVNATKAIILGDDELAKGVAAVRDLDSGEQSEVALSDLIAHLG